MEVGPGRPRVGQGRGPGAEQEGGARGRAWVEEGGAGVGHGAAQGEARADARNFNEQLKLDIGGGEGLRLILTVIRLKK